ncbi:MAG: hypothetical protein QM784_06630 [Polyangiaceae bacterium]
MITRPRLRPIIVLVLGLITGPAWAERVHVTQNGRILLGELVSGLPEPAAALELGAAPKPGTSRLFDADELERVLREVGSPRDLAESVRVVRATKRWSQKEFVEWAAPSITEGLPTHATLVRLEPPRSLVTSTKVTIGTIVIGQLPKRRGSVQTSVVIELRSDGMLEQRLSVPMVLELANPPAAVKIPRGQSITVTVALGATRVSASATLLQEAAVGSTALCRIVRTQKVLRVRLDSPTTAEVAEK